MKKITVNDTDISYLVIGNGLPCLVMHGGLGLDHTYLHPWLDPLRDTLQLIYYDHRGNGRSGRPPAETLTFQNFCADADMLRQYLGLEKIIVMGHSYGGFIALEYAKNYPEQVSHLILLNTTPRLNYFEEIIENAKRSQGATQEILDALDSTSPTTDEEFDNFFRLVSPLYFYKYEQKLGENVLGRTIWSVSANACGVSLLQEYNANPYLKDINIPTLILTGKDDFITPPSQAQLLHDGIKNSEMHIIEQAGHFSYAEQPDVVMNIIRKWVIDES